MSVRLIGAIMVIVGCSCVGFSMAIVHRKTESSLARLICAIEYMECELQYHLTPLPELCVMTSEHVSGEISFVFRELANLMVSQQQQNAKACMDDALERVNAIPSLTRDNLLKLGQVMGRFDLQGQLSGLASIKELVRRDLDGLQIDKDARLRSYQTLGICAGVALVILFI